MVHYRSLDEVTLERSWVAIGVFDGVHRGHQAILQNLTAGAHANGAPAVVLTFWPHPAVVLGKRLKMNCLTDLDERAELIGNLGVDVVVTQAFTPDLAALSALEFMRLVARHLGLRSLWAGYDFALGRGREGTLDRLAEIGKELGYTTQAVGPVRSGEEVISSSMIRRQVQSGDVTAASQALGRYYALHGPVVHGDGRGRRINIPTANIDYPPEKVLPSNGIYACWAWLGGEKHPAATNIGINPTFTPDKQTPSLEAHLLDFNHEMYGQDVKLEFVERLRDELKFSSVDALLDQIHTDIENTRKILSLRANG